MPNLHETAVVHPGAEIGESVEIGPYCVVGERARIGPGTRLMSHVVVDGITRLGVACTVFPFATLGTQTQDLKFKGGHPRVEIGDRTTIREYVTVNAATCDGGVTQVGSECHIMAYAHIAHDCVVGDQVIIANCGTLAGHVVMEDCSILGGLSGIHQFVRIGRMAIIGGCSKVTQDVPPFMMADGHPLAVRSINRVGLERRGMSRDTQRHLKQAFRILFRRQLTTSDAVSCIRREVPDGPEIRHLADFVEQSTRGIAKH